MLCHPCGRDPIEGAGGTWWGLHWPRTRPPNTHPTLRPSLFLGFRLFLLGLHVPLFDFYGHVLLLQSEKVCLGLPWWRSG